MFCTVGFINAYGVFQQYYTQHFLQDKTEFQISWLGSFATFMLFSMAPLAGYINDRFGPTVTVGFGAVLEVVAIFMISLCTQYYQFFLAQGVLLGFSLTFVSIPAAAITPRYFPKNRGAAQGITIAGSSMGGVLWPIALNLMLGKDQISFGWTIRIVGFIMIGCLAIVLLGLRRPPTAPAKAPAASTEEGEQPATMISDADRKKEAAAQIKTDLKRLRHPSFLFLCGGLALAYFGFFVPFFFVSTYAVHIGASESFAFYLISILNAASFFGRILPGFVADRVGYFNILTISIFGSGVIVFCWTAANTVAGLVVWTIAFGFISGVSPASRINTLDARHDSNPLYRPSSRFNSQRSRSWQHTPPWAPPSASSCVPSL